MEGKKNFEFVLFLAEYIGKDNVTLIQQAIDVEQIEYAEDLLDLLIVKITNLFLSKKIDEQQYNSALSYICSKMNIDSSDILMRRYNWLKEQKLDSNFGLYKNHQQIYEIFDQLNRLFCIGGIEHYYTSGILSFILIGKQLERYHHDLDVFVLEEDLKELEALSAKFGFKFVRKLGERPDRRQRRVLKMYYKDSDIPITVFMYSREKDGSVIQKDYFYDENDNLLVEEIYNSPMCVELSFSNIVRFHNGIPYKAISLEALFACKNGGRPKDIYDCSIMQPFIDEAKLRLLKTALQNNPENVIFEVTDEGIKAFMGKMSESDKKEKRIFKGTCNTSWPNMVVKRQCLKRRRVIRKPNSQRA